MNYRIYILMLSLLIVGPNIIAQSLDFLLGANVYLELQGSEKTFESKGNEDKIFKNVYIMEIDNKPVLCIERGERDKEGSEERGYFVLSDLILDFDGQSAVWTGSYSFPKQAGKGPISFTLYSTDKFVIRFPKATVYCNYIRNYDIMKLLTYCRMLDDNNPPEFLYNTERKYSNSSSKNQHKPALSK